MMAIIERDPSTEVEFEVVGGMCRLKFKAGMSCGRDPNGKPGFGFDFVSESERLIPDGKGKFYGGMGVIKRDDAKRLADLINAFLTENPPVSEKETV